jgi:hypothetical protein
MSEPKRRRVEEDTQPQLYALKLECPVCLGRLGYEPGMVMGVTTCQPMAHALCVACCHELPRGWATPPNCPLCRQPITSFLPLAGLTDVEADKDAAAALKLLVAPRVPAAAAVAPVVRSQPPPAREPERLLLPNSAPNSPERRRERERFACKMITDLLVGRRRAGRNFEPGDVFHIGSTDVPEYEVGNLSLRYGARPQRMADLRAIAVEVLPALQARFAEFTIEVDQRQIITGSRFGYLMYRLVYLGALPPPARPEPLPDMSVADYQAQLAAYERARIEAADRRLAEQLQAQ